MASILDMLQSDIGKQLIGGISNQTGQDSNKTASVLSMGLPILLGAMKKNANSEEGARSLNNALEDNRHDGSILNNLGGLLGNNAGELLSNGSGILGHVLGGKQDRVEQTISKASGVDSGSVGQILKMAAPVLMGVLGSQKRQDNVGQNGISSLLGSLSGQNNDHDQSFIEKILDADGDGSVVDDLAGMFMGGNKGGSGMLGGFGGLFGK